MCCCFVFVFFVWIFCLFVCLFVFCLFFGGSVFCVCGFLGFVGVVFLEGVGGWGGGVCVWFLIKTILGPQMDRSCTDVNDFSYRFF